MTIRLPSVATLVSRFNLNHEYASASIIARLIRFLIKDSDPSIKPRMVDGKLQQVTLGDFIRRAQLSSQERTALWNRKAINDFIDERPLHISHYNILRIIDSILLTHGIESLSDGYGGEVFYLNSGDTYNPTIALDTRWNEWHVGVDMEDIVTDILPVPEV